MTKRLLITGLVMLVLVGAGASLWLIYARLTKPTPTAPVGPTVVSSFFPTGDARPLPERPADPLADLIGATSTAPGDTTGVYGLFAKIHQQPVAGLATVGTSTPTLFAERATGNVFLIQPESRNAGRLSHTTLPKLTGFQAAQIANEVFFFASRLAGERVEYVRGRLLLPTENTSVDATTASVSRPLIDLALAPDGRHFFALESTATGGARGAVGDTFSLAFEPPSFASPLAEWQVAWPASSTVAIQTKPAAGHQGLLYLLDVRTKALRLVLSNLSALATRVAPTGAAVLYSSAGTNGPSLAIKNLASQAINLLPIKTIAEKCTWSADSSHLYCAVPTAVPTSDFPDSWYRGETLTEDTLWSIDYPSLEARIIYNPRLASLDEPIDAAKLTLAADGSALYLTNRRDGSLWLLNLNNGFE